MDGEQFYRIGGYHLMPDFFMTIVSASDHWMFLSSNGALTAGRKDRDHALFPYYTDDKIHDQRGITGSRTCCLVESGGKLHLWEPFTTSSQRTYPVTRNLYKSIYGNKIIFEEINTAFNVAFRYGWYNSERFGWVRKSEIRNLGDGPVELELLDGIMNILPHGMDYVFQNEFSNLSDAYKKNELIPESRLGLFTLSSIPADKAEPSESLIANVVWSTGPGEDVHILLSDRQVQDFAKGQPVETEHDIRAARGAYYLRASLQLKPGEERRWYMVAELDQDATDVTNLDAFLRSGEDLAGLIERDIAAGTEKLTRIVASADGLQAGREELSCARHFSNTLFNVMRGGVFGSGYAIDRKDLIRYMDQTNRQVLQKFSNELDGLPAQMPLHRLAGWSAEQKEPDLERICREYLPLTFSRRHGDPSRPWNLFSIDIRNKDGSDKLNYQGNWRDIFQNWEALGISFPGYLEGMLARFLNASTADGYNPYRITREGVDWECPDPGLPWANIGYWGDHQVIYLQKLLEQSEKFYPGSLEDLFERELFVCANVPYRLRPFDQMERHPKDTILFDHDLNRQIEERTGVIGADGRLLTDGSDEICRLGLGDKVLITLLAKLDNFIPEAGIWLNTQRPEWNDANNALVGNGASMVTLYYLRRFVTFWKEQLEGYRSKEFRLASEVTEHLDMVRTILNKHRGFLSGRFSDAQKYEVTRELGEAGTSYRNRIYAQAFTGKKETLSRGELLEFFGTVLAYLDHSIASNRREDGLYHAYNLVAFRGGEISVRHLYEMLEGQVAVLSSGALSTDQCLEVMDALKSSAMFRSDQYSYMLYPDRELPRFTEKNNLSQSQVDSSPLLSRLLEDGNTSILSADSNGICHFNGTFRNASVLKDALHLLDRDRYGDLVESEEVAVLELYEKVFDHQSFTGRSGTFFGYEGLGSIYWHMVSKLLLAVQECFFRGIREGVPREVTGRIADHYFEIRAGIGSHKPPDLYGAFPTDAYSHTPAHAGVQQPGLTGQVKEDVISRFGELGLHVERGKIRFNTALLNREELVREAREFRCILSDGQGLEVTLDPGELAFTFCQVPVIFTPGPDESVETEMEDGRKESFPGNEIPESLSAEIFARAGRVRTIKYHYSS